MNINFSNNFEETKKARLAFQKSSAIGYFFHKFGFWSFSALFIMIAAVNELKNGGKQFGLGWFWFAIPLSLFFGWLINIITQAGLENTTIEKIKKYPDASFGTISITIDQTGLSVQAPLGNALYNWKWVNEIRTTSDYLFLCSQSGLLFWIPVKSLGTQRSEFISELEKLTSLKTQTVKV